MNIDSNYEVYLGVPSSHAENQHSAREADRDRFEGDRMYFKSEESEMGIAKAIEPHEAC